MARSSDHPLRRFLRHNALSLVALALVLVSLAGQLLAGHRVYNAERLELGLLPLTLGAYVTSGHAMSATFENWESEFLQMGMFVMLTVVLRQKGSAESRPMSKDQEDPRIERGPKPWPVRAGGIWKTLYAHSLAAAFFVMFLVSFALHAEGSWRRDAIERVARHEPTIGLFAYVQSADFWFESFQNWQSEFLAVLSLVVLSIWLRQKDSPQSKPLEAPHSQTGT
ncbi:MAG: hypothetical protein HOQ01_09000 [Lysobacter sp.]|nr:hypothetical protein [Lysobacter sp.]